MGEVRNAISDGQVFVSGGGVFSRPRRVFDKFAVKPARGPFRPPRRPRPIPKISAKFRKRETSPASVREGRRRLRGRFGRNWKFSENFGNGRLSNLVGRRGRRRLPRVSAEIGNFRKISGNGEVRGAISDGQRFVAGEGVFSGFGRVFGNLRGRRLALPLGLEVDVGAIPGFNGGADVPGVAVSAELPVRGQGFRIRGDSADVRRLQAETRERRRD